MADIQTPDDVKKTLQQSCYDCDSNEPNWPWYSRIAQASWLMARDVKEGRVHLNFSEWHRLSTN